MYFDQNSSLKNFNENRLLALISFSFVWQIDGINWLSAWLRSLKGITILCQHFFLFPKPSTA
jgi:hypothetical protein